MELWHHLHKDHEINRAIRHYNESREFLMAAIDDFNQALTAVEDAVANVVANPPSNSDNPTDDATFAAAATTLNGLAAQLNAVATAGGTTAPGIPTTPGTVPDAPVGASATASLI